MKNTEKIVTVELSKEELNFLLEAVYEYKDRYKTSEKAQNKANSMENKLWQGIEQMRELLKEGK